MSDLHEMANCLREILRNEEINTAHLEDGKVEQTNVVCLPPVPEEVGSSELAKFIEGALTARRNAKEEILQRRA